MSAIRDYKDLIAWQKAMDLVEEAYRISAHFPKEEVFGLRSQIRRAAVSIPSNVSEGSGRMTRDDFVRFLVMAAGSCNEVETQALLSVRLKYTTDKIIVRLLGLCKDEQRLLRGLIQSLSASTKRGVSYQPPTSQSPRGTRN
ncbi:MAG: four helix bundle protein [Planctomycetaceae bacterium]|nr:four helix bundle protein [Planctomycetaceae bacterium]